MYTETDSERVSVVKIIQIKWLAFSPWVFVGLSLFVKEREVIKDRLDGRLHALNA